MNRTALSLLLGLTTLYGTLATAATPTLTEVAKLTAGDAAASDFLGYSVDVDGDTAIIGAYGDDDLGNESGAVYVFQRDASGNWAQQQKLTASDGVADARFGWAVAIEGDTAVIGKETYDFFNPTNGTVYVFTRDSSGAWSERQKLTAPDGFAGDYFGESLALSGNTLVVGAKGDNDLGSLSGSAYVFTNDSSGVWSLQQKLLASHGTDGDFFGSQVAVDGDTAAIAAWGYDYSGTIPNAGIVYLFSRDATGNWTEGQTLEPQLGDQSGKVFGKSVALKGDTAVVGADLDDQVAVNAGAAYVFTRDLAGNWSSPQKLTASDAQGGDYFGQTVDIDGTNLVIGAYGDDDNGTDAGSLYTFSRDASGVWNEHRKLLASDGANYDYLASVSRATSLSGTTIVAGARMDDTAAGPNTGSAYVFDITPSQGPDISTSTKSVTFGDVLVGQTAQYVVTVSSIGTSDLAISSIAITGGVNFSQANNCPATLPPATACQVTINFTPTTAGTLTDSLVIQSNDPQEPTASVALSGNGITGLPDLVVTNIASPDPLIVGDYVTVGFTIANQGASNVPGGYYVHLYLDNTPLGMDWVSYAPDVGATKDVTWFIQVPRMPRGSYTLRAIVDTLDYIVESNESNNEMTKAVAVQPN